MGDRLTHGLGGRGHWLDMLGGDEGKVNVQWHSSSRQLNHSRHIEFRIILLHVLCSVLLAELLDHRFQRFGFGDRLRTDLRFLSSRINPDRRILEHVFVPLRFGTLHGQQIKLLASSTNQTGIEIVLPDFLPITLILIWR
jgi:hypothetical protein